MKNNTRVRLSYTATDPNTNDTVMDLDLSFENVDYVKLKDNLNTWLKATGYELEVVRSVLGKEVPKPAEAYYKNSVMERTN